MRARSSEQCELITPAWPATLVAGLSLWIAWLVAGSFGPWEPVLRGSVVVAAVGAAVVVLRPRPVTAGAVLLLLLLLGLLGTVVGPAGSLAVVAAVITVLATTVSGPSRKLLLIVAWSVIGFAVYHLLLASSSLVWHASNAIGGWLALGVTHLTGQRLATGPSFGGLDFLVLMTLFVAMWSMHVQHARKILPWAVLAIVLGHVVYLIALNMIPVWIKRLPPLITPEFGDPYEPPPFQWSKIGYWLMPWFFTVVGGSIQAVIAVALARWSETRLRPWVFGAEHARDGAAPRRFPAWYAAIGLAALLPVIAILTPQKLSLRGKTIAAFESGQLDWNVPGFGVYGRQSAGVFGMLPVLSQSLGGEFFLTADLAPEDLRAADVLLVLNPDETLTEPLQRRIWQYVRAGGTLLVGGHGYHPETAGPDTVNALLAPTDLVVQPDAAASGTGNWQRACQARAHPACVDLGAGVMPVLADTGASIETGWRGIPLVIGRWGWSAPQQDAVWDAAEFFHTTDRLGDLVLIAEQRVGRGRVVVLGDSGLLTNERLVRSWAFVGRLLAYLADGTSSPQAMWRQLLALLCAAALLVPAVRTLDAKRLLVLSFMLIGSPWMCHWLSHRAAALAPNGNWIAVENRAPGRNNRLAYIDASHLEAISWQDWGFDAVNGLALTLMRSDYLPLMMTRMDARQLENAGLVVLIGPGRDFSSRARTALAEFVRRGGILICLAGAEDAGVTNRLLADYQLQVPRSPVPTTGRWREPEPMGRVLLPYYRATRKDGSPYAAHVAFWAAWPVQSTAADAEVLVAREDGRAVVISRRFGRGAVVVIGDTYFAANKNLEYATGEPFDGRYDNADFWHWLLSHLTDKQGWTPPPPPPAGTADSSADTTPDAPADAASDAEGGA